MVARNTPKLAKSLRIKILHGEAYMLNCRADWTGLPRVQRLGKFGAAIDQVRRKQG